MKLGGRFSKTGRRESKQAFGLIPRSLRDGASQLGLGLGLGFE